MASGGKKMSSKTFIGFLVASHMTVSSTMLVLNKAVLQIFKAPTTVLLFQVGSSALILWVIGKMGYIKVDGFEFNKAVAFGGNAVAFMVLLYTNAKALESANVESVIVFRTLSIFVTAYGDIKMLQGVPLSRGATGALTMVLCGSIMYAASDKGFQVKNLAWVAAYGLANAAYPIVTKLVILGPAKQMTTWGKTYYNNLITFLVYLPALFLLNEHKQIQALSSGEQGTLTTTAIFLLALSCLWGTAISFLGFLCLENITPTTFNVMGNANKLLTLVVNGMLWEHHATLMANMWLGFSLLGAGLYGHVKNQETPSAAPQPSSSERVSNEGGTEMKDTLLAQEDVEAGREPAK